MTDERKETRRRPSFEALAAEHVAWLARERRHTQDNDDHVAYAIAQGWANKVPGILRPDWRGEWFRIDLTEEGRLATQRIIAAQKEPRP
jgi:hypothetical protein